MTATNHVGCPTCDPRCPTCGRPFVHGHTYYPYYGYWYQYPNYQGFTTTYGGGGSTANSTTGSSNVTFTDSSGYFYNGGSGGGINC